MQHIASPETLAAFGLRLLGRPEPLEGGWDNGNFRVPTDRGAMVVREYRVSGIEKVRAELRLVAHLAEHGYPTPPPLAAGGEPVLDAERPVAVFPWVAGEVPEAMTPPLAERAGELLARMHLLTADWDDDRVPVIDRHGLLRDSLDLRPPLAGVDAWHEATRRFLDERTDELDRLALLPSGPLHHDLHRHNLLVADGEVTAVLDFDELNRGPLVIDLARALQYAALDRPDLRLPRAVADAALAGYERTRPLSGAERELLPLALDLAGLVDTALFLEHDAAGLGLTHVDESHSWSAYLRNTNALA
ncbi:phosphotransferase [Glycomyces sp. NRRL B-16210]|uniref:phosphotransferase n=1 Tax=Glycomyces sp. NRRL B-16210 TaxID=1463821 RepID=UPI0004C0BD57|nr:phosphotransferase [Glycomyces sp. NRRL B-16210]